MKFGQLTERLVGIPSLVALGDEISSSNHFFFSPLSLAARLGAGPDGSRFSVAAAVPTQAVGFI